MKKVLFATTALVLTAGVASAEVTLSGDARMGVTNNNQTNDFQFSSRARVKFSMTGTTDGGLEFGASFRADNASGFVWDDANNDGIVQGGEVGAGGAQAGRSGEVYLSGAFGRLGMGDVDGAAQQAVGQVDGVGYTGLSDYNEITYLFGSNDPSAIYSYTTGQLTFYASIEQPSVLILNTASTAFTRTSNEGYSIGAKWATDAYSVAIGYESIDDGTDHVVLGGSATFSGVTLKAVYGMSDGTGDEDQYAVSASGAFSGVGVTAFYNEDFGGDNAYGLGASYDLGGGAALVGGVVSGDQVNPSGGTGSDTIMDLGVTFTF